MNVNGSNQPNRPDDPRLRKTPSPVSVHRVKDLTKSTSTSTTKVSTTYKKYQARHSKLVDKYQQLTGKYKEFVKRFTIPHGVKKERLTFQKAVTKRNVARARKMKPGPEKTRLLKIIQGNVKAMKYLHTQIKEESKIINQVDKDIRANINKLNKRIKKTDRIMSIFSSRVR